MTIAELQEKLAVLGFGIPRPFSNTLDLPTRMALREFRRYARLPFLAVESVATPGQNYVDRLTATSNTAPYTGPIHAEVGGIEPLVDTWIAARWRCPVVIQAWTTGANAAVAPGCENIWDGRGVRDTRLRMYAFDFSGHFTPISEGDRATRRPLGDYTKAHGGGPRATPPAKTLPTAEVLPDSLLGKPLGDLSAAERSTFKVIRALSEVETIGFYDAFNAYDTAIVSLGVYHWALGYHEQLVSTELPAFLALVQYLDGAAASPTPYFRMVEAWGIRPATAWPRPTDPDPDWTGLWDGSARKYTTELLQQRSDGAYEPVPADEAPFFRGWHWCYRLQAAARHLAAIPRAMWTMARIRIRDVLATPWSQAANLPPVVIGGTSRPPVLGDVFTSELAVALLLRWHINRPGDLIAKGESTPRLVRILEASKPPRKARDDDWSQCQDRLAAAMLEEKNHPTKDLTKTLIQVARFPTWTKANPYGYSLDPGIGALDRTRRSFLADTVGLPAAPPGKATPPASLHAASASVQAAVERRLLLGYEAGVADATYEVRSVTTAAGRTLVGWYRGKPGDPPKDALKRLTTLVLHDPNATIGDPPPQCVLPLVAGALKVLRVTGAGDAAALVIEGRLRCWLPQSFVDPGQPARESQDFKATIGHGTVAGSTQKLLQFKRLAFDDSLEPQGWTLPLPVGELAGKVFSSNKSGGSSNQPPGVAALIGLTFHAKPLQKLLRRLEFLPPRVHETLIRMQLTIQMPLEHNSFKSVRHQVRPFPFSFDASQMPGHEGGSFFVVLTIRQAWAASGETPTGRYWILTAQVPEEVVTAFWNSDVAAPVHQGLHLVQDGRSVSMIPSFAAEAAASRQAPWVVSYWVTDRSETETVPPGALGIAFPGEPTAVGQMRLYPLAVSPPDVQLKGVSLPNVRTTGPGGPALAAWLALQPPAELEERDPSNRSANPAIPALSFSVCRLPGAGTLEGVQTVRMGALELDFPPGTPPTVPEPAPADDDSRVLIRFVSDPLRLQNRMLGPIESRELNYSLSVRGIRPGGQDDVPGEQAVTDLGASAESEEAYQRQFLRPPPILIPEGGLQGTADAFTVTCREIILPGKSQTVVLRLRRNQLGASAALRSAVVIDPHPFLIARVGYPEFGQQEDLAITDEIGHWTNSAETGAGWSLSAGARGFDLILPPQGVGEAMHRRREDDDIVPDQPADFRFSPHTFAALKAGEDERRFADAPWNLRRILGYPGQRAPGAGVDHLEFELLYGLSGSITAPLLRLAEVGSRLGFYPGQQPPRLPWRHSSAQQAAFLRARQLWQQLYPTLASRLGILELWTASQPKGLSLQGPDGLTFALRAEADLAYPIPGVEPDNARIPHAASGLRGSFAWAFESDNIYEAIWRTPQAVSALLTRPQFSALGGWGGLRAGFDNNRSSIGADIAMGRVSSLTIERVGRIGALWNRAKHVIVYERTVAGSRQFYQEQHPLLGIAAVRKVDEYVEILEEERAFPDNSSDALNRGPVVACRFAGTKPVRIRVNSRWGEDVGKTGWKIPLWVPDAAPADLYPKPVVHLMCAGRDAALAVSVPIDEPQKLYFFTSTDPDLGADTDAWPAVMGVDFPVLDQSLFHSDPGTDPLAGTGLKPPAGVATTVDGFARPDVVVPAGCTGFTLGLGASGPPVNMVAERAEQAITARLRNITLTRGLAIGTIPQAMADIEKLKCLHDGLLGTVLDEMPIADISAGEMIDTLDGVSGRLTELRDRAQALAVAIDTVEEVKRFQDRVSRSLGRLATSAPAQVEALLWQLADDIRTAAADLATTIDDFPTARAALIARIHVALDADSESGPSYRHQLDRLPGTPGELTALLGHMHQRVDDLGADLQVGVLEARCAVCDLDLQNPSDREAAQSATVALRSLVSENLNSLEATLADVLRPWIGERVDRVRVRIREQRDLVRQKAVAIRYEVLKPEPKALDALLESLGKEAAGLQTEVEQAVAELLTPLPLDIPGLGTVLDELAPRLDALVHRVSTFSAFQDELGREITRFAMSLGELLVPRLKALEEAWLAQAAGFIYKVLPTGEELRDYVSMMFGPQLAEDIKKLLSEVNPTLAMLHEELARLNATTGRDLKDLVGGVAAAVKVDIPDLRQIGDTAFRVLRALGHPPEVPRLEFPRGKDPIPCGYYFHDLVGGDLPRILNRATTAISPLLAQANRLTGNLLNPIEIKLPTTELSDRLRPFKLDQFTLSSLFPNFAGLKLDALFANLRAPLVANDRVMVTHGEDPQHRSGWLQLDVNVPFDEPATVFALAGVTLRVLRARFEAVARIEAVVGQAPRQSTRGSIRGDWDLQIGGLPVAVLQNCALEFADGGHIRFDISPDRIRLQQTLAFLADLLASFGYSDRGFSVAVTPTGIRSILDLPLPDVQAGAFGIANLRLGFEFALEVPFTITTLLNLGRKVAPFTLTVFILGGAGYLEVEVTYQPGESYRTRVQLGIMAAASLAIALGPIKGGVYAYFGITVDFDSSSETPSRLTIGIMLLFAGEVSLLGLVAVSLRLGLEAQYSAGGRLAGRGFVSYRIKICWFLTLKVQTSVSYTFRSAGSSGGAAPAALAPAASGLHALAAGLGLPETTDPYRAAASDYIDMFA